MRPSLDEILADQKNRIAFEALCAMLQPRGHPPMALVGAGLSARAGYPGWTQLLDDIHQQLKTAEPTPGEPSRAPSETLLAIDDVLWRAEAYCGLMGVDAFRASLARSFQPRPWQDDCLENVVRLPFSHVFTTNYDTTLEEAHQNLNGTPAPVINWADAGKVMHFMAHATDPAFERHYVHLHGRYDTPESMVLRDSDYVQRYVQSDATPKKLFALFATQRFVFLGFSLNDADLMAILRDATAHARGEDPRHVAIIPTRPSADTGKPVDWAVHRERYVTKFGIAPIFYDTSQGYEGFAVLIEEIARRCGVLPPPGGGSRHESPIRVELQASAGHDVLSDESDEPGVEADARGWSDALSPQADAGEDEDDLPWLETTQPSSAWDPAATTPPPTPVDPDDPHRGRFGGSDTAGGRLLTASVTPTAGDDDWFTVRLEVRAVQGAPPVTGSATFFLHPTFRPDQVTVKAAGGKMVLELMSYGAFTVGVRMDDGTELELNLADDPTAPMMFRMR